MLTFKKKQPHEKPIDSAMADFFYIYIGADTKTVLNSEDFYTYLDIVDSDINIPYNKYLDNAFRSGCMSIYSLLRSWFIRKRYGLKDILHMLERLGDFDNSFNEYFLTSVIDRKSILLYSSDDFKLIFSSEILYKNNNLFIFLIRSLDVIELDLLDNILHANPKGSLIAKDLAKILTDLNSYQDNESEQLTNNSDEELTTTAKYCKSIINHGFNVDCQKSLYIILMNFFMKNNSDLRDLHKMLISRVKIKEYKGEV